MPRTLNVSELIGYYIDHQLEVIERRSQFRLEKAEARAHIVRGLLIALDNIDRVVQIIRSSETVDDARVSLMEEFELSEIQANHILDMPLRRLTALETGKLRTEYDDLQATSVRRRERRGRSAARFAGTRTDRACAGIARGADAPRQVVRLVPRRAFARRSKYHASWDDRTRHIARRRVHKDLP